MLNQTLVDGYQALKHTYDEFTHLRGSIDVPKQWAPIKFLVESALASSIICRYEPFLQVRYPPFDNQKYKAMSAGVYLEIPKSA